MASRRDLLTLLVVAPLAKFFESLKPRFDCDLDGPIKGRHYDMLIIDDLDDDFYRLTMHHNHRFDGFISSIARK